jgi:hypothetical protein
VGPKQASVSKVGTCKLCVHIGREDQKVGKFDLGGVGMMVSIQASVSGSILSIFANLCLLCLCCHKSPKRVDCSEHGPICRLFELILVIHANTSNGTNHIV